MTDDIITTGLDAGKTAQQLAAEAPAPNLEAVDYFDQTASIQNAGKIDVWHLIRNPNCMLGKLLYSLTPANFASRHPLAIAVNLTYLKGISIGQRVVECGTTCMEGHEGMPYESTTEGHGMCVLWEVPEDQLNDQPATTMGTSLTWGTRRIQDVQRTREELIHFGTDIRCEHLSLWLWLWDRIHECWPVANDVKLNRSAHLISILAEECMETGKDLMKIQRFGLLDRITHDPKGPPVQEGPTNQDRVVAELNDIMAMVRMLVDEGLLPKDWQNQEAQTLKQAKVRSYMGYARRKGVLVP